ncbi:Uncharacterised protein [Vibrio cholerae]|nr:Uncharacterised protein [Vibrio cholerae]
MTKNTALSPKAKTTFWRMMANVARDSSIIPGNSIKRL